ncbi:hypothetical protein [Rhodococcoides kroppenstedtii]|uniref:hypothetical protein n=1 Tax=Rhodococcoides kroppenstedtii TaxID=293050 RepID=UPI0028E941E3|nr:hypothetical protein [Rhodococcus kroppenstedtii]
MSAWLSAVVGLLAACSASTPPSDAPMQTFDPPSSQVPTITTGAPTNSRGAIEKQWLELAGAGCDNPSNCDALFSLNAPVPATGCLPQLQPENGELLAFPVILHTGDHFDPATYGSFLRAFDFKAIDASGYTSAGLSTDASINCAESDTIPASLAKRSKYSGFVVLDVPTYATTLSYDPFGDGGWEWNLNGGIA